MGPDIIKEIMCDQPLLLRVEATSGPCTSIGQCLRCGSVAKTPLITLSLEVVG